MSRDIESMLQGLRGHLADGAKLTGIRTLSAGHSNETYLLEGIDRILRMPPSREGLLPPYDMAHQHAVLAALGATQRVPVPRVHELCLDAGVIGDPFFVMARLPGEVFEYAVPDWLAQATPEAVAGVCGQWAQAIFALHGLPLQGLPLKARTPREEAAHWLQVTRQAQGPAPLVEVLEELVRSPAVLSGPPTPLHGDAKPGNCLWHDGRLVALLDWEMAMAGEPLTDLGYMLQFYDNHDVVCLAGFQVPGWWPRQQLIDRWEAATGRSARGAGRHEALGMAKVAAILCVAVDLFRRGRSDDERLGAFAPMLDPYAQLACATLERN